MSFDAAVGQLAGAPQLLMMIDYDGTLAPIVADPEMAQLDDATRRVLDEMSRLPDTLVAVVSGRRRADLVEFLDVPGLLLIGGHGAETGEPVELDDADRVTLDGVVTELERIAQLGDGAFVEVKPTSAVLHVRQVKAGGDRLKALALDGPGRIPGVRILPGKEVVEISVSRIDKGTAVRELRARHPEGIACYIGDDVTDEDAFSALDPPDIGIKVGEGETLADLRLGAQDEVMPFLQAICGRRKERISSLS